MTTAMVNGGSLVELVGGAVPPAVHARGWVNALRAEGAERFRKVGLPNTTMEAWRNTNLRELAEGRFVLAGAGEGSAEAAALKEKITFGRDAAVEMVFVNGQFSLELSNFKHVPLGVTICTLGDALACGGVDGAIIERHLGKHASIERNPFVALNTAFLGDGAYVRIGKGLAVERPIHLVFLGSGEGVVSLPRALVVLEENSEGTVVETYAGSDAAAYLANAVTEIVVGKGARLDHCKVNQEGLLAFHIATMQVNLAEHASFVSHSATLGGRLTRNDLNCYMGGEFAEATLNGVVVLSGEQHCDNHTLLHHEKGNCPSHELYKHVLADKSSGVFKGQIYVQKDAQKTDSKQTSKTLLLSNSAVMNSQPALEIYADDVKCTHGSTIGPVDEGAVFYLQSRGLNYETARALLTYAFAADITRRIRVGPVRARIEDFMSARQGLPQDLRITEGAGAQVAMI